MGIKSIYLGHPLVDICKDIVSKEEARRKILVDKSCELITLLPLSRRQEISYILPVVLETAKLIKKKKKQIKFCFCLARKDLREEVLKVLNKYKDLDIIFTEDNYIAIKSADLVIAKSGTVNLETALMGVKQIVFYKINSLSYFVAKKILRIKLNMENCK